MPSKSAIPPVLAAKLRRRAEQQLKAYPTDKGRARIEADAQRLVHELQVHEMELEMQNAELRDARQQTEALLEKYTELYDFAPVGYFSLAPTGRIQLVNLTGARLVGIERSRLLGRFLSAEVAAEYRSAFQDYLKRVFADGTRQTCVVKLMHAGQPVRTVRIEAERSLERPECRAVVTDITERQHAEEVLRRNEALFSALVQQAPVGVYVVDDQLRLLEVNPRARPVFSRVQPLLGRNLGEAMRILWPEKVAAEIIEHFRHTLQSGSPYFAADFSQQRRDSGVTKDYEWQLQRITLPAGQHGVVCFFNDITERKRAEATQLRVKALILANESANREIVRRRTAEATLRQSEQVQRGLVAESRKLHAQLRQLTRQTLLAQEEERKEISRELHDQIAQILAGINVQLAALAEVAAIRPRDLRQRIIKTQRLVGQSIHAVHRYARELRPSMLDDLGLIPALRAYIRDLPGRKGLRIRFTAAFPGVEALDNTRRTVLYRVAQEALTNVTRHAHARLATVRILPAPDAVRLIVHDDGKSFAVTRLLAAETPKRLGLLGMRERVEMVGGTFAIESSAGHGTTVCAEIPLRGNRRGTYL